MLFTWRKNKGTLGRSQEVFTVFTKQKRSKSVSVRGVWASSYTAQVACGHVQAVCRGLFTLLSVAQAVRRLPKTCMLQLPPSKSSCFRSSYSGPIRAVTRHGQGAGLETTQQVIFLLSFIPTIEDAWILWTFLCCAFPHTVTGSLINGDSLHSESLDSNDGLAGFSLPFGFLLRKGFAKQFNHLKQECQKYS